jgi:hypothetical protein
MELKKVLGNLSDTEISVICKELTNETPLNVINKQLTSKGLSIKIKNRYELSKVLISELIRRISIKNIDSGEKNKKSLDFMKIFKLLFNLK